MTDTVFSLIPSGGNYASATDQVLAVRGGATDLLVNLQTAVAPITFSSGSVIGSNKTAFIGTANNSPTENTVSMVMPYAGTIDSMYIKCSQAPGGTQTNTYTMRQNGASTALTATITGTSTTANDTTHSITVAAGDTIDIQCVTSSIAVAGTHDISVRINP